MESIIRNNEDRLTKKITLEDFYNKILRGKDYPDFYRQVSLLIFPGEKQQEFLILESLGKGSSGFVFLAYHQRKLTALKMS
ncbi:MAG: hypothetical protein MUF15_11950 [Acidobacteria bacterium]|jgi:hypothetical protein|nr:hypothetical protein [Acidobacteriota bacterium]